MFFFALILLPAFSCKNHSNRDKPAPIKEASGVPPKTKPPGSFQDTLRIELMSAVFYSPDAVQLQKIRSVTDPGAFAANMHEYDYLRRTSRMIIKKEFPQLSIIEAKSARYLLFAGFNKLKSCIDLDQIYDPYGLYVFNRKDGPLKVDMANTATNIGFYLYNK